jgi:hypothetical protein
MSTRRCQSGYSLVEALFVLFIIGVSVSMAAPGIQAALQSKKSEEATLDVVRVGRRARMEAISFGRAHIVRFTRAETGSYSNIKVFRGFSGGCNMNDWNTVTSSPACGEEDSMCIDELDFEKYGGLPYDSVAVILPNNTPLDLCYTARGNMMWRTDPSATFVDVPPTTDPTFVITLSRLNKLRMVGVARNVLFPFGGMPRVQR